MQFLIQHYALYERLDALGAQREHGALVVEDGGLLRGDVLAQEFFRVEGVVGEAPAPISPAAHDGIAAEPYDGVPEQCVVMHFRFRDAADGCGDLLVARRDVALKAVGRDGGQLSRGTAVEGHEQFCVRDVFGALDVGIGQFGREGVVGHILLLSPQYMKAGGVW